MTNRELQRLLAKLPKDLEVQTQELSPVWQDLVNSPIVSVQTFDGVEDLRGHKVRVILIS